MHEHVITPNSHSEDGFIGRVANPPEMMPEVPVFIRKKPLRSIVVSPVQRPKTVAQALAYAALFGLFVCPPEPQDETEYNRSALGYPASDSCSG